MYSKAIAFLREGKLLRGIKLAYHSYKHSPEAVGPALTRIIYEVNSRMPRMSLIGLSQALQMSRRVVGNRGDISSEAMLAVAEFLASVYTTNGIRNIADAALRHPQGQIIPLKVRIERVNNHNQLIQAFPVLISNLYYLSGLV
jgi:hypothetical protein